MKMLDISSNNHPNDQPIDFGAAHGAGWLAVMIKATEGLHYVNPWLDRDADAAHKAGFHVGYYHFARPGQGNPSGQAAWFVRAVAGLPRDIGLAVDLEVQEGQSWTDLDKFAVQFFDHLPTSVKHRMLYTNPDWLNHLSSAPWGHELWLASWGQKPRQHVTAWQEGQTRVAGFEGQVDYGILYL